MLSINLSENEIWTPQWPTEGKKGTLRQSAYFEGLENYGDTISSMCSDHFDRFNNTEIKTPSYLFDEQCLEPEPVYFLPSGLLDDEVHMDFDQTTGHGGYCLIDHAGAIRSGIDSAVDYKLYAPCASDCVDSSSSDASHSSTEYECSTLSNTFSCASVSPCYFSPRCDLREESADLVIFNAPDGKLGVSMDDIKSFKQGSLLYPDDEVLLPWGKAGESTWIQVLVEVHGYPKWIFSIPIKCRCAVTTRGKLAWDIAQAMEFYHLTVKCRTRFQGHPSFRRELSGQRLLALHRNVAEQDIWWRVIFSDSHTVQALFRSSLGKR